MTDPCPSWRDRVRRTVTSGRVWFWTHIVGAAVWLGLSVPGMTTWRDSVPFLVLVSLYTIVLSHIVGAVAAIGARKADPADPT